ncbi:hypothetical protein J2Z66_003305 [Paenibacillus eucommiae]|uniref:Uncharacterized protein n=1 Tax=Paenibacillus eucommiae TaxID=1355755 RepID=A0ABS4IVT3_9BACL|nr:hypothetical protein [Paenibacillus eucommiae]
MCSKMESYENLKFSYVHYPLDSESLMLAFHLGFEHGMFGTLKLSGKGSGRKSEKERERAIVAARLPRMKHVLDLTMFLIVKVRIPGQSVTLMMFFIAKRGRRAFLGVEKRL